MIDYGIMNKEAGETVEEFRIGEREQRRKEEGGRNKTVYFNFLKLLFSVKCNQ
jgi:hypothetical protein